MEHTAGAIRAAEIVLGITLPVGQQWPNVSKIATIIDRETGAKELLEACKAADKEYTLHRSLANTHFQLRAAIVKA